jgi:hypothetical protein
MCLHWRVFDKLFWTPFGVKRGLLWMLTPQKPEKVWLSRSTGMKGAAEAPGPLPKTDHCGYEVAIQIVVASLGAGRYSKTHKQWGMVRRFWSAYLNQVRAARDANANPIVVTDADGKSYMRIGHDACGSLWF